MDFCQSLIKGNYPNSRASDDIDMKLGTVSKLDKRNKTTLKRFENDVMSKNYDVITIFLIYDQFGLIRKPDSRRIVGNFYLTKTENRTKKSLTQLSHYCFE